MTSPEVQIYCSQFLFADDTIIFIAGTCYDTVIDISNKELEQIDTWLNANKLTINIRKSHYIMFHRTRIKRGNYPITIRGNSLTYSSNIKCLRVIIDYKLNWYNHLIIIY